MAGVKYWNNYLFYEDFLFIWEREVERGHEQGAEGEAKKKKSENILELFQSLKDPTFKKNYLNHDSDSAFSLPLPP